MSALKKEEVQAYKDILLGVRARLRGDVTALADAALRKANSEASSAKMPIHMADVGSDNFEQENTINLMQNDEEQLSLVEGALERIEQGAYGLCVECESRIPKMRLNAIPFTPHCIKCATRLQTRR